MSSWESSACYPRSTFYPLSDGPSMRNRRITMPLFPTCSACLPPSQAPFCHYTLRTVTNRPEGTFGSLRYAFGGDHPSQTARQAVSSNFRVSGQTAEGPYFNSGSTRTGVRASKPPAYPTHPMPGPIRAGRNLPDKEFRYLRTVIVTAAVYRGFNSHLRLTSERSS